MSRGDPTDESLMSLRVLSPAKQLNMLTDDNMACFPASEKKTLIQGRSGRIWRSIETASRVDAVRSQTKPQDENDKATQNITKKGFEILASLSQASSFVISCMALSFPSESSSVIEMVSGFLGFRL